LHGSGIWTLKKFKKSLTSIEIKLFRRTGGYTAFDYKRNKEILEELEAELVDVKQRDTNKICYDM
jgi:hypothetical protein